jgi:hypothetical protein
VAAENGWQSTIHGCKDGKNMRLDEDKRGVAKQKKEVVFG